MRCLGTSNQTTLRIEITPNPSLIDQPARIRVVGTGPGDYVRVRVRMEDDAKRIWSSQAVFLADAEGVVDLLLQAPEDDQGSYRGVDAMGLLWSMGLERAAVAGEAQGADASQAENDRDLYIKKELTPALVRLEAEILEGAQQASGTIASKTMVLHYVAPGTSVRALDPHDPGSRGLCGLLFLPEEAPRPLPAVISLGGSGGGLSWETAGALAGHGYAALALPYFGFEPLPPLLNSIPLEYFERAIEWLAAQPEIDARRMAIHGQSRGGEAALLVATRQPTLRAIVGVVPGSVVWPGTGKGQKKELEKGRNTSSDGRAASSWTYRGEALPFVPYRMFPFKLIQAYRVIVRHEPVEFEPLHRASLRNRAAVERAAIPAEKIRASVLLISAGDDRIWPSSEMCRAIEERMRAGGAAFPCRHIEYPRAGHMIRLPNMPATVRESKHPGLRFRIAFGGEPQETARASAGAWRETLEFFDAHLR